ncbi:MAG: ABC transporter substrate-binding protein [Halobacteriota archaeon]
MARDYKRRDFVKGVGAASAIGVTGLAGCLGDDDGGDDEDTPTETPTDTPDDDTPTDTPGSTESIPMGSILPITGTLEDLGPGMEDAVNLAVEHMNDAGGPLGREIDMTNTDSETSEEAGLERYQSLVAEEEIVAVVGAASSGVSAPIAEQVADDEVMQISPASTSPVFAEVGWADDIKYFGRTAPNDAQQGVVMAKVLDEYIEAETAGFLYVDNPYGEGLAQVAEENFSGEEVGFVGYDDESQDFTSALDQLFEDDPDAVGWVGYPGEGRSILPQWDEGGYGGEWVMSEGLDSGEFFEDVEDLVEGQYITTPAPEETDGRAIFDDAHETENPGPFDPHSYDAAFIAGLAIEMAGEASGTAIAENFLAVCNEPGEVVTVGEFDRARDLIADGEDIQYEGASSPLAMNNNYENLNQFGIYQIEGAEKQELEIIPREDFEGVLD